MEIDLNEPTPPAKRQAVPSSDDPNKPVFGKPTYDGVIAGRVSGRKWKQPRTHRSSAAKVSLKGSTFEQREEREKRKQENILKSGIKLQIITNPKTLEKIQKSKQRKQLKFIPDNLPKK